MNKFINKFLLFTLPVIVILIGVEYILRIIPNDYSYKNEYLSKNSNDIKILVLGSSHSFYGINPIYFSKNSFNSSHVSQSINYDYLIFEKYKSELTNLRVIVFPISYFTLFSQIENGLENWRVKNYSIYYNIKNHSELKYNFEIVGKKPLNVIKTIDRYMKGHSNLTVSELGFGLSYSNVKQSDLMKTGILAAKRHTKSTFELLNPNLEILSVLINESKKMGIKILLFTPPARESYIENLNIHQLTVMRDSISNVVKLNSNVSYYDFLRDPRFIDDDFKDADHLNGVGAMKLTQIIEKLINEK